LAMRTDRSLARGWSCLWSCTDSSAVDDTVEGTVDGTVEGTVDGTVDGMVMALLPGPGDTIVGRRRAGRGVPPSREPPRHLPSVVWSGYGVLIPGVMPEPVQQSAADDLPGNADLLLRHSEQ
jgi:hypothetical protein